MYERELSTVLVSSFYMRLFCLLCWNATTVFILALRDLDFNQTFSSCSRCTTFSFRSDIPGRRCRFAQNCWLSEKHSYWQIEDEVFSGHNARKDAGQGEMVTSRFSEFISECITFFAESVLQFLPHFFVILSYREQRPRKRRRNGKRRRSGKWRIPWPESSEGWGIRRSAHASMETTRW